MRNSTLSDLEHECNQEMQKLYQWCCANELQINPEKSEALMIPSQISAPKTDLLITFNDSPIIICIETSKYLDIKLDFKLNYQPYISLVKNKVARSVGILSKLRYLFLSSALLLLYYLFIHLHFLFGLPLWGNTNPTHLTKLQRLQNKSRSYNN